MADSKIPIKDMAVAREFLEPFKWDTITVHKMTLGNAAGLLTTCLEHGRFWTELGAAHGVLKAKYPCNDKADPGLQQELDQI